MRKLKTLLTHCLIKSAAIKNSRAVIYAAFVVGVIMLGQTDEVQPLLASFGLDRQLGTINLVDLLSVVVGYIAFVLGRKYQEFARKPIVTSEDIAAAIETDSIEVVMQPVQKLSTGVIDGFEMLVRIDHPKYGIVKPFDFDDAVNKADPEVIRRLTLHVLTKTAEYYNEFRALGYNLRMSVNLTAEDLSNSNIVPALTKTLLNHNMPLEHLTIEISQSTLKGDISNALKVIASLDALDVKVCLDNYGTSVASFMHFKDFLIDGIKIDGSITHKLDLKQQNAEIVQAIVHTAHSTGTFVTAKHIETTSALNKAKQIGCDFVQGYIIAPPMTFEQAKQWIKSTKR